MPSRTRLKPFTTKLFVFTLALTLGASITGCAADAQERGDEGTDHRAEAPPAARRVDQVDTYHGVEVADPYRWLEDVESEESRAFIADQQRWLTSVLDGDPRTEELRARFLRLNEGTRDVGVQRRGERLFFMRRQLGSGSRAAVGVIEAGRDRILLDSEAEWPTGTRQVMGYQVDDSGDRMLMAIGNGPGTARTVRFMDVGSGEMLEDEIPDLVSGTVNWAPDGQGVYYSAYPVPEGGTVDDVEFRDMRVLYHRLGTSIDEDELLFEHPEWGLSVAVLPGSERLVIVASEPGRNVNHVLVRGLAADAEVRPLPLPGESTWSYVHDDGDRLVFVTKWEAPRARVLAIDPDRPREWTEMVPESEHFLNGFGPAGDGYLGVYIVDAVRALHAFDAEGRLLGPIDAIESGGGLGFTARHGDSTAFVRTGHVADAGTVWELDLETGDTSTLLRPNVDFDRDDYVLEQYFAESADGTRVPLSVVRRRDVEPDGTNPVFMYGYGAWNWVAYPYFQVQWLMWVEQGGLFVVPNIRGGGEYGEEWHQAGIKLEKQNGFDDYIAAAEWLVEAGWTSAGKIVANGGSASGLLAAAATVQRPELFAGAVIDHPGLDLLRSQVQPGGNFLVPEYGSVEDPDEFRALHTISPYHQLREGECYPPMLTTVGEIDRSTVPMHGLKFTAQLQHVQACDNPALLQWVPGGGHLVFGTTRQEQAEILARQLVFALRATEGGWADHLGNETDR